jgi:predicted nucleic acid-binding protein
VSVFVDTSALYALVDAIDENHQAAGDAWTLVSGRREHLVTSSYVLVETLALIGHRLGIQAVRDFQADFVPVLDPVWVDETLHGRGIGALLTVGVRDLSLVDCVSFEIMRERRIDTAMAFDAHFVRQGFTCLAC